MDSSISIIIFMIILILAILGGTIYFKKDVAKYIKENPALAVVLLVILVCYGTYVWHVYREMQKKKDIYQEKKIANVCPDYWQNISKKDGDQLCLNVHKLGKYNLGKAKDFGKELYKDPINKCKFAKLARISWEGIDHLCADVSDSS